MLPTGCEFVRSLEGLVKGGIKDADGTCAVDIVLDCIGEGVKCEADYLYIRQARFNHRNGCANRGRGIVNLITIGTRFNRPQGNLKFVIAVGVVGKVGRFQYGEVGRDILGDVGQAQDVTVARGGPLRPSDDDGVGRIGG